MVRDFTSVRPGVDNLDNLAADLMQFEVSVGETGPELF